MKKLIALLLALLLIASLVTVCFADGGDADGDSPTTNPIDDPDKPGDNGVSDGGNTSPETGANAPVLALFAVILGFAGMALSCKKVFD